MSAVLVLGDVETFDTTIMSARGDDRHFAREWHEGFEDAGLAADLAPSGLRVAAVLHRPMALAVIAEAARLQDRRPADLLDRRLESGRLRNGGERRGADAERGHEFFF